MISGSPFLTTEPPEIPTAASRLIPSLVGRPGGLVV